VNKIIKADFNKSNHQDAIFDLLNIYLTDKMGGSKPFKQSLKKKLINGLMKTGNSLIFFVVENEKFIGMAICFLSFSTFKLKKLLNIHDIIVLPEYRNHGLGRKLMNHIEAHAKKINCGKITLEVRLDNKNAKHLYQSLGYNECEPRMLFWVKII
jgi:ribosomal protein S18 acetylase RimI-like enzyme